ncbi:MAG: PAS domain S-box protein, partial [Candidatus Thorarchaeota archaeon]
DVVVSDFQMFGMDGLELLEELRTTGNDIPFVLLTGQPGDATASQALDLGANYYLRKQGTPESLYGELVHVIWAVVNQKLAIETLQDREKLFRNLVEATFDGVILHDQGIILDINKTLAQMFGYNRDEVLGTSLYEYVAPESVDFLRSNDLKDIETPLKIAGLKKNGEILPLEIVDKRCQFEGRTVGMGVVRDLSEKKRIENELLESKQKLNELLHLLKQALQHIDLQSGNRKKGEVSHYSPKQFEEGVARLEVALKAFSILQQKGWAWFPFFQPFSSSDKSEFQPNVLRFRNFDWGAANG